jgi:hypothetical protein
VVSTFSFTVIFEHGIGNFTGNAEKELKVWQETVNKWIEGKPMERRKDTSDKTGQ